jgi:hypothetical protein
MPDRVEVTIEARFLWLLVHESEPGWMMLVSHCGEEHPTTLAPKDIRPHLTSKYIAITKEPLGVVADNPRAVQRYFQEMRRA